MSHINVTLLLLLVKLRSLVVDLALEDSGSLSATLCVRPALIKCIHHAKGQDPQLIKIIKEVNIGTQTNFSLKEDRTLMLGSKIMCLMLISLKGRLWKKLINLYILCILDVLRCIRLLERVTDGKGNCRVCFLMFGVSISKSRASMSYTTFTTIICSQVEVGAYHYGLYVWLTFY